MLLRNKEMWLSLNIAGQWWLNDEDKAKLEKSED